MRDPCATGGRGHFRCHRRGRGLVVAIRVLRGLQYHHRCRGIHTSGRCWHRWRTAITSE
jgi:hypothetical protein